MKRWTALLLVLAVMMTPLVQAKEKKEFLPLPAHFAYSCQTQKIEATHGFEESRAYPMTVDEALNSLLKEKIDAMAEKARPHLPEKIKAKRRLFDSGAYMRRTGESLMSFLLVSFISSGGTYHYVDFDTHNADILSYETIRASDIFAIDDSIKNEIVRQFLLYFENAPLRREENIRRLVTEEFETLKFTMDTARIIFHIHASQLIEGRQGILHAALYYKDIKDKLTAYGKRQSDNSAYRAVCLTFDDGPTGMRAVNVARSLRNYGGGGGFFFVGKVIKGKEDVVSQIFDTGFSVCYHSFTHTVDGMTVEMVHKELAKNESVILPITGIRQTIMRPPGGKQKIYLKAQIPMAILNWTHSIGSMGYSRKSFRQVATNVGRHFKDGGIVLIHDTRPIEVEMTEIIARNLYETGALIVSPEEIFALKNVSLQNGIHYIDAVEERLPLIEEAHRKKRESENK